MAARKTSQKKLIRSLDTVGFYSDFEKEGTLSAVLIRSPAEAGKVQSITIENLPPGYYLFTADDIPGAKNLKINKFTAKIFGYDDISYSGEPLGILLGPDEEVLHKLLDKVSVNLDVGNLESALHNVMKNQEKQDQAENFSEFVEQINDMPSLDNVISKSTIKEEDSDKTIAFREVKYGLYKTKSLEEADQELFASENNVSLDTWVQKISSPSWQETEGSFCYTDGANIHVYIPSKWTGLTQKVLAETLGIKPENVYIHKTKVSGVFPTGLWRTTILAAQTALASFLTKQPVKLVLSQKEQATYMKSGIQTKITYQTAADKDGLITAMKVLIDIDLGMGNPFAQEITDRITLAACNYYKPQNLYIYTKAHTSRNPPTTISIKVVDSQSFFAAENEMQKVCNKTQLLPDEVRLINAQQDKKLAKKAPFPFDIQIENLQTLLQTVIKNSDFNRKYTSFHMEAIDRVAVDSKPFFALPLRGIGLATGYVVSGYNGSSDFLYDNKIEATLTTEDKLIIHCIKPSQVIQDIWKNTASEILQIPKENILIDSDYNIEEIPTNPEDTNSSIGVMNELIKKCCNDIQKKRFHQPLPISSKRSPARATKAKWDKENFSGIPYVTMSTAATVVEVELDTYTYTEKIKGVWITIDCGELFDQAAALRTIRLEIQQELGMLVKDKDVSCDSINISFIKSTNKSGQIGGLVHNTLPAAFSTALSLALTTQLTQLPCTEDQLFQLIKNRTKANKNAENIGKNKSEEETENTDFRENDGAAKVEAEKNQIEENLVEKNPAEQNSQEQNSTKQNPTKEKISEGAEN